MSDFDKAVADSKKLVSKPSNDELLQLYALFKVANGEDFESAPQPGMFDLKARSVPAAYPLLFLALPSALSPFPPPSPRRLLAEAGDVTCMNVYTYDRMPCILVFVFVFSFIFMRYKIFVLLTIVLLRKQGKAKRNAWAEKKDLSADDAKKQYVELVEKLKKEYGYDENKQPEAVGQ